MESRAQGTRSDIYSLGVLLYELLTGSTPFDTKELVQSGLEKMRRIIREREPLRPSTHLTHHPARAKSKTAHRKAQVPSDLDWIVMKCLEKDRTRRYETASSLAADLKRHLNNEPVVARPPSKLYEFQKTVQRHKFGFAATAALMVALTAGVVVSAWQVVRARNAERAARLAERAAKEKSAIAKRESARALASDTAAREELENTRTALEFIRMICLGWPVLSTTRP